MSRTEIRKKVKFWQDKLGLSNWDVLVEFKGFFAPHETEKFNGIAQADAEPRYKLATIRFHPQRLKQVTDGVIVHELLHCLMAELVGYINANENNKKKRASDWLGYFNEQATSEIERIIMRIYGGKNKK